MEEVSNEVSCVSLGAELVRARVWSKYGKKVREEGAGKAEQGAGGQ